MVEAATSQDNIKVVIRFRPQNKIEASNNGTPCVQFWNDSSFTITSTEGNTRPPIKEEFTFDKVFNPSSTQKEVFDYVATPVVANVLEGFNATIFAYGQTGCGKTHTMSGDINSESLKGLIPRTIEALFEAVYESPEDIEYTIQTSYVEIYMEQIRDLLNPKSVNLSIRQNNSKIFLEPLTEIYVSSPAETLEVMAKGDLYRTTASTKMNETSSRSHSIFIINFTRKDTKNATKTTSTLYLVDLAGSEKVGKTGATGQTLEEAKKINSSLSSLGNVINALTDHKSTHIPYRDSKLTRLLQDSLGGNAKTTLICCTSVSSFNDAESLSTIRFGMRAKNIKNDARVNKQRSLGEVEKLLSISEAENHRLRLLLKSLGKDPDSEIDKILDFQEKSVPDEKLLEEKRFLEEKIEKLMQEILEKNEISEFLQKEVNQLLENISEFENENILLKKELENYENMPEITQKMEIFEGTSEKSEKIENPEKIEDSEKNDEFLMKIDELELKLSENNEKLREKSEKIEKLEAKIRNFDQKNLENIKKIEELLERNRIFSENEEISKKNLENFENESKNYQILLENQRKILENRSFLQNSREKSLILSQKNFKFLLKNSEKEIEKLQNLLENHDKMALKEHETFALNSLELRKKISNLTILNSKNEEEIAELKSAFNEILEENSHKNLVKKIQFLNKNLEELKSKYFQIYSRINDFRITIEFKNRQISAKNLFILKLNEEIKNLNEKYDENIKNLNNEISNYKIYGEKIEQNPEIFSKKIILTGKNKHEIEIKTIRGNSSPENYLKNQQNDQILARKLENMPLSPTIDLEKKDENYEMSPEPFAPPSLLCESPEINK